MRYHLLATLHTCEKPSQSHVKGPQKASYLESSICVGGGAVSVNTVVCIDIADIQEDSE